MGESKHTQNTQSKRESFSSLLLNSRALLVLFLAGMAIGVAGTVAEQNDIHPRVQLVSLR